MVGNARSHPHTPIFHGNGVPQNAPNFLPILAYALHLLPSYALCLWRSALSFALYTLYSYRRAKRVIRLLYLCYTLHSCDNRWIIFFYFLYICVVYHIIDTGVKFSVQLLHSKKCYRYKKRTPAGVLIIDIHFILLLHYLFYWIENIRLTHYLRFLDNVISYVLSLYLNRMTLVSSTI